MPLAPKAFDTLLVLVQNTGRLVERGDLIRAVWGDTFVEENNLSVNVSLIRKALVQLDPEFEYIETVPKHGYRFLAQVQEEIDQPAPLSEPVLSNAQVAASPVRSRQTGRLASTLRGYHWHVLAGCVIYACHYTVTLLLEVTYKFDIYGPKIMAFAPLFFCWILTTSVWGLAVTLKTAQEGKSYSLLLGGAVFVAAAMIAFFGAWFVLPHVPITEAKFQTFAAPAAYLKDIAYILPIALLFLLVPFHLVAVLEEDIKQGEAERVFELLSGSKQSIRPAGTVYVKPWVLGALLVGWLAYSLPARAHLFDNLLPSPYLGMFQVFHQARTILQFALGLYCAAWYYWVLNHLKSKCLI